MGSVSQKGKKWRTRWGLGNTLFLGILINFELVELKLEGSGGYVIAELSEELASKSKLVPNIDKCFLAPCLLYTSPSPRD